MEKIFGKLLGKLPWFTIIKYGFKLSRWLANRNVKAKSQLEQDSKIVTIESKPKKWLEIAEAEIGVTEIRGRKKHNDRILKYHQFTNLKATTDEISWCSSFVCYVMEKANYDSTRSAQARSWLEWGVTIDKPKRGCIVVFWREHRKSWKGHVGFFMGKDPDSEKRIMVLGGNQNDSVKISSYNVKRVLAYKLPINDDIN